MLDLNLKQKYFRDYNGVIKKVEKRLVTTMGGKVTLINCVLDNTPTYCMSFYPMPNVLKQLDKHRRTFLWKGNREVHKFHIVKWPNVIQPKSQCGFGIRDIAKHNKSMLMKWLGRFADEVLAYGRRWLLVNMGSKVTGALNTVPYHMV